MTASSRRWARVGASAVAGALDLVVAATDLLPAGLRYGRLRSVTRRLFLRRPLAVVTGPVRARDERSAPSTTAVSGPRVTLVTGSLDMGGLENVVRMLAEGLGAEGLVASVVCSGGGATFDALAAAGVDVAIAGTPAEADSDLQRLRPDVIEVHNAPQHLRDAVERSGVPWVSVIHNAEIHRSKEAWAELARTRVSRWIAVSEGVEAFHLAHWPQGFHTDVVVVPNASPAPLPYDPARRSAARDALGEAAGWRIGEEHVVVVSLSRYDSQKNIPGLVACFGEAAAARPALKLVVAGPTTDGLEVARAVALRRAGARPDSVALLGPSPSDLLLAAADAFVLDSYFEGWSIAVIEAAQAGLPLILSDVGSGAELLRDGTRGSLVPNPATAATISEEAVRRARRQVRSQRNSVELREALTQVADHVGDWRERRPALAASAAQLFTLDEMVRGHAYWLKNALVGSAHE